MSAGIVDFPVPPLSEGDNSATFSHRAFQLRAMAAELIQLAEEAEAQISPEYRTIMRALYGEEAKR